LVQRGRLVPKALRVRQVRLDPRVTLERLVLRDRPDPLVPQVRWVLRVRLDLREKLDQQAQQVSQVLLVLPWLHES
jgi:hypothetical protein